MYHKWWIYQKVYLRELERKNLKRYLLQVKEGQKPLFIHINKTAGTSIANSLKIPEGHYTLQDFEKMFLKQFKKPLTTETQVYVAIRNPFDKIASQYFFRIKTNQNSLRKNTLSFDEWVYQAFHLKNPYYRDLEIMFAPQMSWFESKNRYKINFIRFENLQEDYKNLAEKYNGSPLFWKKKSNNKDYKSLYSEASKKIIEREFKVDLEYFNYIF